MSHFKWDCHELEDNGNYGQFAVASEGYEDSCALVVSCWKEEEGGVSHIENDDTCKLTFM
jgi:hypothetical protein